MSSCGHFWGPLASHDPNPALTPPSGLSRYSLRSPVAGVVQEWTGQYIRVSAVTELIILWEKVRGTEPLFECFFTVPARVASPFPVIAYIYLSVFKWQVKSHWPSPIHMQMNLDCFRLHFVTHRFLACRNTNCLPTSFLHLHPNTALPPNTTPSQIHLSLLINRDRLPTDTCLHPHHQYCLCWLPPRTYTQSKVWVSLPCLTRQQTFPILLM